MPKYPTIFIDGQTITLSNSPSAIGAPAHSLMLQDADPKAPNPDLFLRKAQQISQGRFFARVLAAQAKPQPITRWEVQTQFLFHWENCWCDHKTGKPATYDSKAEAEAALADHLASEAAAAEAGDCLPFAAQDYRIVEVKL